MNETKLIFDSRKAANIYREDDHYRSGNFSVPPGHIALVELTTKYDMLNQVVFTAIRTPLPLAANCYTLEGIGKRYRQLDCGNVLPPYESNEQSSFTPYRKSIWRLGNDIYNNQVHEYRYILRPGNYYLLADKSSNEPIDNCNIPTIIEVSILPLSHFKNTCEV